MTGELTGGFGEAGPNEAWYDPTQFSQPGNAWGNTGRNAFRGPSNWNLDFSLFRGFPIGRYRVEFRAESTNVFNHTQWGNPVTGLTDPNFMRIRTYSRPQPAARAARAALRFLGTPRSGNFARSAERLAGLFFAPGRSTGTVLPFAGRPPASAGRGVMLSVVLLSCAFTLAAALTLQATPPPAWANLPVDSYPPDARAQIDAARQAALDGASIGCRAWSARPRAPRVGSARGCRRGLRRGATSGAQGD